MDRASALLIATFCSLTACSDPVAATEDPDTIFVQNGSVRLAGTLDLPNTPGLARLEQLRNPGFTVRLFPRMNHDLVDTDTGTFPATLFPEVIAWARARMGG